MSNLQKTADLTGRILIATIFLLAGLNKVGGYEATAGYMASQGVPGELLPLVILLEVGGALAIIVGLFTRLTAAALAGFSIASALLFHFNLGDQVQFVMFFKNLGLAGGFLFLFANGPGPWSLDAKFRQD